MGTSKDILINEAEKYKEGFNIAMEMFNFLDEDSKKEIDKKLKEIGL